MGSDFYLVWREGSSPNTPTFKHQSFEMAKSECIRLARENPGVEFHICKHVASALKQDVLFETVDDFEIPF